MTGTTTFVPVTVHNGDDKNPLVVDARVWGMYARKANGEGPKDIAAAYGITPGPVGSAFTRVRDAIDAGRAVVVGGDEHNVGIHGVTGGTTATPVIDADKVADDMMPGASDIMRAINAHTQRATDTVMNAQRALDAAKVTAAKSDAQAKGLRELLAKAGFDFDAYTKAITPAPATPEGDKPEGS